MGKFQVEIIYIMRFFNFFIFDLAFGRENSRAPIAPPIPGPDFDHVQYYFSDKRKTWNEANSHCQSRGMVLALPKSIQENGALIGFMYSKLLSYDAFWIGANDQEREGVWVGNDNLLLGFSNWHPGEPNNRGDQDCAKVGLLVYTASRIENVNMKESGKYHFLWDDIPCDYKLHFACGVRSRKIMNC